LVTRLNELIQLDGCGCYYFSHWSKEKSRNISCFEINKTI